MRTLLRLAVLVAATAVPVSACTTGPAQQVEGAMGTDLDDLVVRYHAWGGRQPVDARFVLQPDGRAELYVGTAVSLPQAGSLDTVGFFAGTVDRRTRGALAKAVRKGALLEPPQPPAAGVPDSVTRTLEVSDGQRSASHTLAGRPSGALQSAEEAVLQAMVAMLGKPVRAVRAGVTATVDGGTVRPEVRLESVGTEPVEILLFDPADPGAGVRAGVTFFDAFGGMHGDVGTPPEHLAALAAAGTLPAGAHLLAPGEAVALPLPGVAAPAGEGLQLAGGLEFLLLDGDDRRPVSVGLAAVPVTR